MQHLERVEEINDEQRIRRSPSGHLRLCSVAVQVQSHTSAECMATRAEPTGLVVFQSPKTVTRRKNVPAHHHRWITAESHWKSETRVALSHSPIYNNYKEKAGLHNTPCTAVASFFFLFLQDQYKHMHALPPLNPGHLPPPGLDFKLSLVMYEAAVSHPPIAQRKENNQIYISRYVKRGPKQVERRK